MRRNEVFGPLKGLLRGVEKDKGSIMVSSGKIVVIISALFFLSNPTLVHAEPTEDNQDFIYADHEKRDPFWPLINSKGIIVNYEKDLLITDLVLEGIMLGEDGKNIAIINGGILQVNDTVGVFEVREVRANMVILQKGQERYTLKLKKEE